MITESLIEEQAWAEAPSDPEEAFLFLVFAARARLLAINSGEIVDDRFTEDHWRKQYIYELSAVAKELGISGLSAPESAVKTPGAMHAFDAQLARVITRIRIAKRDQLRAESVQLSAKTKDDIRSKLEELREFVNTANISEKSKERLHKKIDAVEAELSKRRFDITRVWVLAGALGTTVACGVSILADLPAALETLGAITEAVNNEKARESEQDMQLLAPPPLQIEDQRSVRDSRA